VPDAEIVIYTMSDEEHVIRAVVAAGAHGCVQKSEPGEHLLTAIEAVARHQPFFFSTNANQPIVVQRTARAAATVQMTPIRDLTPRQLDVARMLAQGMSNHEVAKALGIATNTAKTHRAAIMRRLDATSIVDVVLWALRHNLVDPVDPFAVC
jgi:DNA-binding NarL/FixJ family response regulator